MVRFNPRSTVTFLTVPLCEKLRITRRWPPVFGHWTGRTNRGMWDSLPNGQRPRSQGCPHSVHHVSVLLFSSSLLIGWIRDVKLTFLSETILMNSRDLGIEEWPLPTALLSHRQRLYDRICSNLISRRTVSKWIQAWQITRIVCQNS